MIARSGAPVNAPNTVKCVDGAVTLWFAWLTTELLSSCQVLPLKKNTPAGGVVPPKLRVICTGCENWVIAAPLAAVAVSATALLTNCCPAGTAGALVLAICTVVWSVTAPGGKTTSALPSGSPTGPPPDPMTAELLFAFVGGGGGGDDDELLE